MLTGKPVFPYGNLPTLIRQHMEVMPPGVGTVRVQTPPELEAFVAWLLEKRVEDRPHSADVALTVLKEAETSGDALRTVPGGPTFIELARKYDEGVRSQSGVKAAAPADPPKEPAHRSSPSRPPASPNQETRLKPRSQVDRKRVEPAARAEPPSAKQPRVLTAARRTLEPKLEVRPLDDEGTIPPSAKAEEPKDFHDAGTVIDPNRRSR
jgi:hypothetical protein